LGQVFEEMLIEAEDLVKPLEELYSFKDLAALIQNRLHENGIDQRFEFAVESAEKPGRYIITSEDFDKSNERELFRISLLSDKIAGQNDYQLFLIFPNKVQGLWKSVSLLLLMSAVLTLIVMATFGTTIYMIIRQKKISDIKSDFINNMTHEFKTPIATISLATDSISNPKTLKDRDSVLYYAGIIREENKRMDKQVENVLQMSLLDKHDVDFNMQVSDIHELIRNAIRKISLQVEERKGRIEVALEAADQYAEVDEVHFTNAIINLLDNANKYSKEPPEISVSTRNADQQIHIQISDKGIGMSRETQKKVFEKFYRESSGNVHNVKGFGLGLTYVKAVLQVFRGKIRITSNPGKGSTFEIIIPIIDKHG
jgi:signal transduction histidine kinase